MEEHLRKHWATLLSSKQKLATPDTRKRSQGPIFKSSRKRKRPAIASLKGKERLLTDDEEEKEEEEEISEPEEIEVASSVSSDSSGSVSEVNII